MIVFYQGYILVVVDAYYLSEVARKTLPRHLQREHTTGASLEMSMVGSRGTTLGTIVEHHHLRILLEQLVNLAIRVEYALGLMLQRGDSEVLWEYWERIDEQLILAVDILLYLFLRTILFTEETRALGDGLLIHLGSCGNHSCGVPLYLDARRTDNQFAGL